MRYFYVGLLALFTTSLAYSQTYPRVDTLYINPDPLPTNTAFEVIFQVTYTSTHGNVIWYKTTQTGDTIKLQACHQMGMGAAITTFRDTVAMQPLPAGNYELQLELMRGLPNLNSMQCFAVNTTIYDTLNFNVGSIVNVGQLPESVPMVVYPNPAIQRQVTVETRSPILELYGVDALGRIVYAPQPSQAPRQVLHLQDLPKGWYTVVVRTAEGYTREKLLLLE